MRNAVRTVSAELSTHSVGLVVAFATNDILVVGVLSKSLLTTALVVPPLGE